MDDLQSFIEQSSIFRLFFLDAHISDPDKSGKDYDGNCTCATQTGQILEDVGRDEAEHLTRDRQISDLRLLGSQGFDPCGFSGTLRELCAVKIEEDDGCTSDQGSDGGCAQQSAEQGSADFAQIFGFFDAGKSAHDRHKNQRHDQHLQEADVTVTDDIDPVDGSQCDCAVRCKKQLDGGPEDDPQS